MQPPYSAHKELLVWRVHACFDPKAVHFFNVNRKVPFGLNITSYIYLPTNTVNFTDKPVQCLVSCKSQNMTPKTFSGIKDHSPCWGPVCNTKQHNVFMPPREISPKSWMWMTSCCSWFFDTACPLHPKTLTSSISPYLPSHPPLVMRPIPANSYCNSLANVQNLPPQVQEAPAPCLLHQVPCLQLFHGCLKTALSSNARAIILYTIIYCKAELRLWMV